MSKKSRAAKRRNKLRIRQQECSPKPKKKMYEETNKVYIVGRIESEFKYNHECFGTKFYRTRIRVERLSKTEDLIPIIVAEQLIGRELMGKSLEGKWVEVSGKFRSYNKMGTDGRSHLNLSLFANQIDIYEDANIPEEKTNINLIVLDGYICKTPIFRKTPLGWRITDLLVAVNRTYGKSDYIPCIAWGDEAQKSSEFKAGERVLLCGRIQSRKYFKRFSPDSNEGEYREVNEVSITEMRKVEE